MLYLFSLFVFLFKWIDHWCYVLFRNLFLVSYIFFLHFITYIGFIYISIHILFFRLQHFVIVSLCLYCLLLLLLSFCNKIIFPNTYLNSLFDMIHLSLEILLMICLYLFMTREKRQFSYSSAVLLLS